MIARFINHKIRCPKCGGPTVLTKKNNHPIWGCQNYPTCYGRVKADELGRPLPPEQAALDEAIEKVITEPITI